MTTHPIDRSAASDLARDALIRWGVDPQLEVEGRPCPGGWRFRASVGDGPTAAGGSDAVVFVADGTVHRVPTGASDAAIARLLKR